LSSSLKLWFCNTCSHYQSYHYLWFADSWLWHNEWHTDSFAVGVSGHFIPLSSLIFIVCHWGKSWHRLTCQGQRKVKALRQQGHIYMWYLGAII
jgi:hypothetical protein